jgi:hypothetical protein
MRCLGGVQLSPVAKAGVSQSQFLQLCKIGGIDVKTAALIIGCIFSAGAASGIPFQAQPVQIIF